MISADHLLPSAVEANGGASAPPGDAAVVVPSTSSVTEEGGFSSGADPSVEGAPFESPGEGAAVFGGGAAASPVGGGSLLSTLLLAGATGALIFLRTMSSLRHDVTLGNNSPRGRGEEYCIPPRCGCASYCYYYLPT